MTFQTNYTQVIAPESFIKPSTQYNKDISIFLNGATDLLQPLIDRIQSRFVCGQESSYPDYPINFLFRAQWLSLWFM